MLGIVLFLSGAEIVVILLVALLLFGTKRLPEVARGLGKGLNEIKKATGEIQREIMGGINLDNNTKEENKKAGTSPPEKLTKDNSNENKPIG